MSVKWIPDGKIIFSKKTLERHEFPYETFIDAQYADITYKMRLILLNWIYEVNFKQRQNSSTYDFASILIDHYLRHNRNVCRNRLQLVGATALFMASKFNDQYGILLDDVVYVAANSFTRQDVKMLEWQMLDHIVKYVPFSLMKAALLCYTPTARQICRMTDLYAIDLCVINSPTKLAMAAERVSACCCMAELITKTLEIGHGIDAADYSEQKKLIVEFISSTRHQLHSALEMKGDFPLYDEQPEIHGNSYDEISPFKQYIYSQDHIRQFCKNTIFDFLTDYDPGKYNNMYRYQENVNHSY